MDEIGNRFHYGANNSKVFLRVCAATWLPWVNVTLSEKKEIFVEGPMADILRVLARLLKFRYNLTMPPDDHWGVRKDNGEWTGLVGMVHRNECDYLLGPLASAYDRSQVVTYTASPYYTTTAIMAGRLFEKTTDIFGYFAIFDWQVWFMALISLIFLSWMTVFVDVLLPGGKLSLSEHRKDTGRVAMRFFKYFFEFLGTFLCESAPGTPDHDSSRIALGFWWMTVIVMMNTFSGQLKASMFLVVEGDSIQDIETVAERPKLRPLVWKGSAYEAYVRHSELPAFRNVWGRISRSNGTQLQSWLYKMDTMKTVQKTKSVVIGDTRTMKWAISTVCEELNNGEFYLSKQEFFSHTLGPAVNQYLDRNLLKEINKRIRWLLESDIVNRWADKQYSRLERCMVAAGVSDQKMLGLDDILPVFYMWLLMLGFSSLGLFFEIVVGTYSKANLRRKQRKKARLRIAKGKVLERRRQVLIKKIDPNLYVVEKNHDDLKQL